jgi:hypothetical protein
MPQETHVLQSTASEFERHATPESPMHNNEYELIRIEHR